MDVHSLRNARARVDPRRPRHAGTAEAATPTSRKTSTVLVNTNGSCGGRSKSSWRSRLVATTADADTEREATAHQSEPAPEHRGHHATQGCAEREANADFPGASARVVRHESVDACGGQQQRQHAERGHEQRGEPGPPELPRRLVSQRDGFPERQVGIDCPHGGLDGRCQHTRVSGRACHERHRRDVGLRRVEVLGRLRQGHVDLGFGGGRPFLLPHVAHHADHRPPDSRLVVVREGDPAAERGAIEVATRECLVDHHHQRRTRVVLPCEVAAAADADARRRGIARPRHAPDRMCPRLGRRPLDQGPRAPRVASQRHMVDDRCGRHAGDGTRRVPRPARTARRGCGARPATHAPRPRSRATPRAGSRDQRSTAAGSCAPGGRPSPPATRPASLHRPRTRRVSGVHAGIRWRHVGPGAGFAASSTRGRGRRRGQSAR